MERRRRGAARGALWVVIVLAGAAGCAGGPPRWERIDLDVVTAEQAGPEDAALPLAIEAGACFLDLPGRICLADRAGRLVRSPDAGAHWLRLPVAAQLGLPGLAVDDMAAGAGASVWLVCGDGRLVRSDDAGAAWREAGRIEGHPGPYRIAVRPEDADTIAVGCGDGAVLVRTGDAAAWRLWGDGFGGEAITALAFAPGRGDRLYVGTASGLWRTSDGGASWRDFEQAGISQVRAIRIHPRAQHMVAVLGAAGKGFTGLWVSRNAGGGWRRIEADMGPVDDVVHDPTNPYRLYVIAARRVYRSDDIGHHFWPVSAPGLAADRLLITPTDPPTLFAFRRGGATVYRSP